MKFPIPAELKWTVFGPDDNSDIVPKLRSKISSITHTDDRVCYEPFPNWGVLSWAAMGAYELSKTTDGSQKQDLEDIGNVHLSQWTYLCTAESKNDDYFGCALIHKKRLQIIIAHRGTIPSQTKTLEADIEGIIQNQYTSQMNSATTFVLYLIEAIQGLTSLWGSVSITGHSLGGWLAQVTAFSAKYFQISNFNTKSKITQYNGQDSLRHVHCVAFDSPGASGILQKMNREFNREDYNMKLIDQLDISIVLGVPNFFNVINKHLQHFYMIDLGPVNKSLLSRLSSHIEVVAITKQTHGVDNFVKACNDPKGRIILKVIDWPLIVYKDVFNGTTNMNKGQAKELKSLLTSFLKIVVTGAKVVSSFSPELLELMKHPKNGRFKIGTNFDKFEFTLNTFPPEGTEFIKEVANFLCCKIHCESINEELMNKEGDIKQILDSVSGRDLSKYIKLRSPDIFVKINKAVVAGGAKRLEELNRKLFDLNLAILCIKSKEYVNEIQERYLDIESKTSVNNLLTHALAQASIDNKPILLKFDQKLPPDYIRLHFLSYLKSQMELDKDVGLGLGNSVIIKSKAFLQLSDTYKNLQVPNSIRLVVIDCLEANIEEVIIKHGQIKNACRVVILCTCQSLLNEVVKLELDINEDCIRDKILRHNALFQGREVELSQIFQGLNSSNLKSWFGDNIPSFMRLIDTQDKLEFGHTPLNFFDMHDTYVHLDEVVSIQNLERILLNQDLMIDTYFVICGERNPFHLEKNENRITFVSKKSDELIDYSFAYRKFKQICRQNSTKFVYLFEHFNNFNRDEIVCKLCYNPNLYIPRKCKQYVIKDSVDFNMSVINKNQIELLEVFKNFLEHLKKSNYEMTDRLNGLIKDFEKQQTGSITESNNLLKSVVWCILEIKTRCPDLVPDSLRLLFDSVAQKESTEEEIIRDDTDRFQIIADNPGMGKSTTMARMVDTYFNNISDDWVVSTQLRNINISKVSDLDSIFNIIQPPLDELSELAFRYRLNQHSSTICIFLDGFDETSEEDRTQLLQIFKILRDQTKIKIKINTRLHQISSLESAFDKFAFLFVELDNFPNFLKNFWLGIYRMKYSNDLVRITNLCSELSTKIVKKSLEYLESQDDFKTRGSSKNCDGMRFLGIPLHLRMLSEVYLNVVNTRYNEDNANSEPELYIENYTLSGLFRKYLDRKFEICFSKLKHSSSYPKSVREVLTHQWENELKSISRNTLQYDTETKQRITILGTDFKNVDDQLLQTGILVPVYSKVEFIHRTFAEYYFAQFIYNQINHLLDSPTNMYNTRWMRLFWETIINIYTKDGNVVIRHFLNEILSPENDNSLFAKVEMFHNSFSHIEASQEIKLNMKYANIRMYFHNLGYWMYHQNPQIRPVKTLLTGLITFTPHAKLTSLLELFVDVKSLNLFNREEVDRSVNFVSRYISRMRLNDKVCIKKILDDWMQALGIKNEVSDTNTDRLTTVLFSVFVDELRSYFKAGFTETCPSEYPIPYLNYTIGEGKMYIECAEKGAQLLIDKWEGQVGVRLANYGNGEPRLVKITKDLINAIRTYVNASKEKEISGRWSYFLFFKYMDDDEFLNIRY